MPGLNTYMAFQGRDSARGRLLAPDGRYEHAPVTFIDVATDDIATIARLPASSHSRAARPSNTSSVTRRGSSSSPPRSGIAHVLCGTGVMVTTILRAVYKATTLQGGWSSNHSNS